MRPRRGLRLPAGILALLAAVFATAQPPPPRLALPAAFDRAAAALDAHVTALEQRCDQPAASRTSYATVVDLAERRTAALDDAATAQLDRALATTPTLSAGRRAAVVACIDHHCGIAAASLRQTLRDLREIPDDPFTRLEVAEYRATLRRLLAVRARLLA